MFNVLRGYANYDKEIGYTQGMNFVVANILLSLDPDRYSNHKRISCYMPHNVTFKNIIKVSFGVEEFTDEDLEKKAFWIFTYINYQKNWRDVYKSGTPKVKSLVKFLRHRVSEEIPEVYNHIRKHDDVNLIAL
jgi:hypothetical protein